jgi:hypothetical protein
MFISQNVVSTHSSSRVADNVRHLSSVFVSRLGQTGTRGSVDPADGLDYFSSPVSQAVPIVADKISLPAKAGTVPLLSCLPPALHSLYADPSRLCRPEPPGGWPAVRSVKFVSDKEYLKLLMRLDTAGMISWTTRPVVVNGIFAVPKKDGTLRLIIDCRPSNVRFIEPENPELPSPSLFSELVADPFQEIYFAKSDVADFYHAFLLPDWLRPYFCLPGVLAGDMGLAGYAANATVYPMLRTLPMGWNHAVRLAQAAHLECIAGDPLSTPGEIASQQSGFVVDDVVRLIVYIDDVVWAGRSRNAVQRRLDGYLSHMAGRGFTFKLAKVTKPCLRLEALGLDLDGRHHCVALAAPAMQRLINTTRAICAAGEVSGLQLASVLGRWTWAMLVRRGSLAVFAAVYRFCAIAGSRTFALWPSVRAELLAAANLAPLLICYFSAPFAPLVVATDASEEGLGVVAADCPPELSAAVVSTSSPTIVQDNAMLSLVESLHWRCIVSAPWRSPEHITTLEMRAFATAVKWLASLPACFRCRILMFSDSAAVVGAVTKGRSSSFRLLPVMRLTAAFSLGFGLNVSMRWLPSAANPADEPSRRFTP